MFAQMIGMGVDSTGLPVLISIAFAEPLVECSIFLLAIALTSILYCFCVQNYNTIIYIGQGDFLRSSVYYWTPLHLVFLSRKETPQLHGGVAG